MKSKEEKPWKTEWTTASLYHVLNYFSQGFSVPDGYEIHAFKAFLSAKGDEIAFRLTLKPKEDAK